MCLSPIPQALLILTVRPKRWEVAPIFWATLMASAYFIGA